MSLFIITFCQLQIAEIEKLKIGESCSVGNCLVERNYDGYNYTYRQDFQEFVFFRKNIVDRLEIEL